MHRRQAIIKRAVTWFQTVLAGLQWAASLLKRQRRVLNAGIALACIVTAGVVNYERNLAGSDLPLDAYPVWSLDQAQRIMVFAPHCDDEVLGAGGLIQAALRQGIDVRVVLATNGDGYRFATMEEFRHAFPQPDDYIAMGDRRQQETLNAVAQLGLGTDHVISLGYPDRGLASMWWNHWAIDQPYRSPYSQRTAVFYSNAFHFDAPYSGASLLSDLCALLAEYRPDLILIPHPNDSHPDHRTLSAFVALAVGMAEEQDEQFAPQVLGYLIHYGLYPQDWGLKPEESLYPPRQLIAIGSWWRWPLSKDDMAAKRAAIDAHRSQQRLLGNFLHSFVRQNELYMQMDAAQVLGWIEGETFEDADHTSGSSENGMSSQYADPVRDSTVRSVRSGADIAGLHVFRLGDDLQVTLDLDGKVSKTYGYYLLARAISPQGTITVKNHYGRTSTGDVWAQGSQVLFKLDCKALGDPDWLIFTAETHQGLVLDHTAWYVIRLKDWPWEERPAGEPAAGIFLPLDVAAIEAGRISAFTQPDLVVPDAR